MTKLKTLGLRHVALMTENLTACEKFYVELLGMEIVWRPDADNVYLSSGSDNLALHRAPEGFEPGKDQRLDHLGFFLEDEAAVEAWHQHLSAAGVKIQAQPKQHRDGTKSFYCLDPDGNSVQMIFVPGMK